MKAILATALFAALVAAAPAKRATLADHVPVTVENLDKGFTIKCGGVSVNADDVENAIAYGVSLKDNGEQNRSNQGPNPQSYPHHFNNNEGFSGWHSDKCKGNPTGRQEYPVKKGTYFEDNTDPKLYRAVYFYDGERDTAGHGKAYYCGTIYHTGAAGNFAPCDISK